MKPKTKALLSTFLTLGIIAVTVSAIVINPQIGLAILLIILTGLLCAMIYILYDTLKDFFQN